MQYRDPLDFLKTPSIQKSKSKNLNDLELQILFINGWRNHRSVNELLGNKMKVNTDVHIYKLYEQKL